MHPDDDPGAARRGPPRRGWRPSRLMLGALTVLLLGFLGGFGVFLARLDRLERPPSNQTDGIVALTGGSQRIGDAIDLLSKGFARRLLITGVNARTSREEIARLNPRTRDLVECCVDLDYRARNTVGNAVETRHWAMRNGIRSLIVVTSNYHMPRTLAELDHKLPGIPKVPYPVVTDQLDAGAWWHSLASARLLMAEYVKYLAVLARTQVWAAAADEAASPAEPAPGINSVRLVAKPAGAR